MTRSGSEGSGAARRESAVRIALIYPELLGTYGDGGNATVLAARARWRGLDAEVVGITAGAAVPGGCDIYLLGGGEDEPQTLAAAGLRAGGIDSALAGGAVLLAVCAGLQVVGTSFPGSRSSRHDGAGLVDLVTDPGSPRIVGDLVVERPGLGLLFGYENHGGRTRLGPGLEPLGSVSRGTGNGAGGAVDGVWARTGSGLVVGSYLHGPVLAQNPALADALLDHVAGARAAPPPPEQVRADDAAARLRTARARQTALGH